MYMGMSVHDHCGVLVGGNSSHTVKNADMVRGARAGPRPQAPTRLAVSGAARDQSGDIRKDGHGTTSLWSVVMRPTEGPG